jgi:hypothetical protein
MRVAEDVGIVTPTINNFSDHSLKFVSNLRDDGRPWGDFQVNTALRFHIFSFKNRGTRQFIFRTGIDCDFTDISGCFSEVIYDNNNLVGCRRTFMQKCGSNLCDWIEPPNGHGAGNVSPLNLVGMRQLGLIDPPDGPSKISDSESSERSNNRIFLDNINAKTTPKSFEYYDDIGGAFISGLASIVFCCLLYAGLKRL